MQSMLRQWSGAASKLADIVLTAGRVYAPLPTGTTTERALKYDVGGLCPQSDGLDWLFRNLTSKKDGTLIFQDVWSRPSDLVIRRPTLESYFNDGSGVYYYLPSFSLTPNALNELYKRISSFQVVGFYVARALNLTFEQRRRHQIPSDHLDQLLPFTTSVYVGAYDQESWVVWECET